MNKEFKSLSYLSQVRRLRELAQVALNSYSLRVTRLSFINHGENTTFRVETQSGKVYLLRIHREGYHTKEAILEELSWLRHLSKAGIRVPRPLLSRSRELVVTVETARVERRYCSLLNWTDGKLVSKSIKAKHMYSVGQMIADMQNNTPKGKSKNRNYWTAEGLIGENPKFGSIDTLTSASKKQQVEITALRKNVLKNLKVYEKKFPQRFGLIHADLHFGNIVIKGDRVSAIDFDDSGFGFHVYDLVIPFISVARSLSKENSHLLAEYKTALIDGYKSKRPWDTADEHIFPELVKARRLLMLGWLNSRSDNPKLKNRMKMYIRSTLKELKILKR